MGPLGMSREPISMELSKDPEMLVQSAVDALPADAIKACREFFQDDLKGFLEWLERTDQRLTTAPSEAATDELRREVDDEWSRVIQRGDEAVATIAKPTTQKAVKAAFRKSITPWLRGNPFILRGLAKPRGYPGDYLMMERFYGGQHELSGGLAGVIDRFLLDHYECVPNRKNRSKEVIRRTVARLAKSGSPITILTLGSGPCREWHELNQEITPEERKAFAKIQLVCLDQDEETLAFCRERFTSLKLVGSVEYARIGLLGFSKSPEWIDRSGTFDLVYGFGIADYFHDEMLSSVITSAFGLLKVGGEVGIPHKSDAGFNYQLADWICDWVFVRRTEEQYVELFKHAVSSLRIPFTFAMDRDRTRAIMFGSATRLP